MNRALISAERLFDHLEDVRIFDLRWSLTNPQHGETAFQDGHIPGAVFVDLDTDLAAAEGDGRHPLPPVEQFAHTLGWLGATPEDRIVVYDDINGFIAARLWWMLVSIGHRDVSLLDGGLDAWTEAGYPIERGSSQPVAANYRAPPAFTGVAGSTDLDGRSVIDVRAHNRYTGEFEPIDPKAGHIPGAINLPISGNIGSGGRFLSQEQLKARYSNVGNEPIISCGSGVNACHTALAMTLAGMDMPDVYIGSFSDWSSRDLPVNTGLRP